MSSAKFIKGPTNEVWQDLCTSSWTPLQPLTKNQNCDVCVVGLGASGLSAAIVIAERGYQVIGIDAKDCASGAAGQNGGFLLAGFDEEYSDNVERIGRDTTYKNYLETVKEL